MRGRGKAFANRVVTGLTQRRETIADTGKGYKAR
jgi:hypothetical protein